MTTEPINRSETPLSRSERIILQMARRREQAVQQSGFPLMELVATNTLWLLDIIERLVPGSTTADDSYVRELAEAQHGRH